MRRMHKIPLNESLLFVRLLFAHPLLLAVESAPFPPPRFITIHTPAFKWKCHPHTLQPEHVNRLFSIWLK